MIHFTNFIRTGPNICFEYTFPDIRVVNTLTYLRLFVVRGCFVFRS